MDPRRWASRKDLWAIGVGAVVSGDFFGWQVTLAQGFGSGLVSLCFATVLYLMLCASVAEVVTVPGVGSGPAQFAKACFGQRAAFLTGLVESLKCVMVVAVITTGIGSYVSEILQTPPSFAPVIWFVFLAAFTLLNVVGGEASSTFQLVITIISTILLLIFFGGASLKGLDFGRYALDGGTFGSTTSLPGVMAVWPFSLWFFLGIEELPLATEVTIDPAHNMPYGLVVSFITLAGLAFTNFFISASIPPGAAEMAKTTYPLLQGYYYIFGETTVVRWSCLVLTVGLIASLHSFIFAQSQLVAQMATDGYFPDALGRRSDRYGTPVVALVAGSALSFTSLIVLYFATNQNVDNVGIVAIAVALFCTLISYSVQLGCFLHLRSAQAEAERTFKSPFGRGGAIFALVLCAISFGTILYLPISESIDYFYGIALALVILLVCTVVREATWRRATDEGARELVAVND